MKLFVVVVLFMADTVGAGTKYCHFCAERDRATCVARPQNQTCATDLNSLGTAHCASAVVRYRNQFGNTMEGFFRGCVDCAENKKTMYAKVGEFFKARRGWFLMQGDIICCTSDNCNTKIPSLPSADAQYRHCNYCLKSDAATCSANQRNQICATDPESYGTSHCASAVLKYEDKDGRVRSGFMRGCINCGSKRTACAVIRSDVKRFYDWNLKQCKIECCTDNNCNNHIPIFISKALAVSAACPDGRNVLFSAVLVSAAVFVNILYYIK